MMTDHTDQAVMTGHWAAHDRMPAPRRIEPPEAQAAATALEALRAERDELWGALVAVKLWRQTVGLGGSSLWDQVDDALAPEPVETRIDRRVS